MPGMPSTEFVQLEKCPSIFPAVAGHSFGMSTQLAEGNKNMKWQLVNCQLGALHLHEVIQCGLRIVQADCLVPNPFQKTD